MPVLLVDRDPTLISIDRQRLNDLGIPAEVAHDHAAGFYGPCGIMWATLIVPEGWQDALPDELPVQWEWDEEAWARAQSDSSGESLAHRRKITLRDYILASTAATMILWLTICAISAIASVVLFLIPTHGNGISPEDLLNVKVTTAMSVVVAFLIGMIAILLVGPLIGICAWLVGRMLLHRIGLLVVGSVLLVAMVLH